MTKRSRVKSRLTNLDHTIVRPGSPRGNHRLRDHLEQTLRDSKLPEAPTAHAELDELLIRSRIEGIMTARQ